MGWKNDTPSGFTQTWKLWRHCCCRYGWYPLLIAPIVSTGCLLSLYSSFGCDFVTLDVGFTPSNKAWNQSEAHLGLFYMYTGKNRGNKYADTLVGGCEWYSDSFEVSFIEGDRTWKVARIMALISGAASVTAALTSWLFLFSPLPASFFWPGLLLPAILIAFLAEGSKFLMFDTAACRTALWTPSGVDSLAQRADSCVLGETAVYTIISGCVLFAALMFVCLKAPDKRLLDEHYGRKYDDNNDRNEEHVEDVESALSAADYESHGSYPRGSDVYVVGETASHADRSLCGFESVSGRSIRSARSGSRGSARSGRSGRGNRNKPQELKTVHSESSASANSESYSYRTETRSNRDGRESQPAKRLPEDSPRDEPVDSTSASKQSKDLQPGHKKYSTVFDDRMSAAEIAIRRSEQQRISESRVSKIEKMELSSTDNSEDLIQKFVTDLNLSFQQDDADSKLNRSTSHSSSTSSRRKKSTLG